MTKPKPPRRKPDAPAFTPVVVQRRGINALIGIALFILFSGILALSVCNRLMFLEERTMKADIGYLKETVEQIRAETDARELDRISVEQLKEDVQTLRASAGLSGEYSREQLKKFDEDIARIFYILRSQRRPK
jgi:hypothetical protein